MEGRMALDQNQQWLTLRVRGMIFRTEISTLQRFPETLLGSLSKDSEFYQGDTDEYVFNRNPFLFQDILDFYNTGRLHFPSNLCGVSIQDEINFWKIPENHIAPCCWGNYLKDKHQQDDLNKLDSAFDTVDRYENDVTGKRANSQHKGERIWLLMEDSASSCGAIAKAVAYIILVCLSILLLAMETVPSLKQYVVTNTNAVVESGPNSAFYFTEFILSLLFAADLILRFFVCPSKRKFVLNFFNILNVVIILTQLVAFAMVLQDDYEMLGKPCWILSCFRLLRILLVYRISSHFSSARVLGLAMRDSLKPLLWILFSFALSIFFFATIAYTVETDEPFTFRSLTDAAYWAMITMTTVGYGDIIPRSTLGKITSGICSTSGIVFMGITFAVISANLNTYMIQGKMKKAMDEKRRAKTEEDKATTPV